MTKKLCIPVLALTILITCCSPDSPSPPPDSPSPPPEMPPFTEEFEQMASDYYKLRFLPDGYPGRYENGEIWAHPLLGTYVISDYYRQYAETPSVELRDAIHTVAGAAVSRMEPFKGGLVFWYPEDPDLGARLYRRHYSGLTQAYYAVSLYRAYVVTGDEGLRRAAEKSFESLLIPAEDGGVYYENSYGVSIAEIPSEPNALILNGWLSILVSIIKYADLTGSQKARTVFEENVASLERLLPLYDVPEYRNSRYGLTGFQYVRIEFAPSADGVVLRGVEVQVPQEGSFPVPLREASRWQNYVFVEDATEAADGLHPLTRSIRLNLVLSYVSHPAENVLKFAITVPRSTEVTVSLHEGLYDPMLSAQANSKWVAVTSLNLAPGPHQLEVPLPWSAPEVTAYPTNFKKIIDGKPSNVYHTIHINRLRDLYDITHIEGFKTYANKWERYICDWASMELYAGLYVSGPEGPVEPETYC